MRDAVERVPPHPAQGLVRPVSQVSSDVHPSEGVQRELVEQVDFILLQGNAVPRIGALREVAPDERRDPSVALDAEAEHPLVKAFEQLGFRSPGDQGRESSDLVGAEGPKEAALEGRVRALRRVVGLQSPGRRSSG